MLKGAALHALRKAMKTLRYGADELCTFCGRKPVARYLLSCILQNAAKGSWQPQRRSA
jgi:hypothetical protein